MSSLFNGKKDFKPDPRDFTWASMRLILKDTGALDVIQPLVFGHGNTFRNWEMLANGPDPTAPGKAAGGAGCCVWSSAANETKVALTDSGTAAAVADSLFNGATTISDYSAATGYDPSTGAGDDGTEIRAALLYRQKTGIVDTTGARHKIGPFVSLEPGNLQHLLEALFFFEANPIGVQIQEAQMDQFNAAEAAGRVPVWSHVAGSPTIGGHCVPEVGRPDQEHIAAVTWRLRTLLTPTFLSKQCDEAWAYLTPERVSKVTGKTYEGATEAHLEEYLHAVGTALVAGDHTALPQRAQVALGI